MDKVEIEIRTVAEAGVDIKIKLTQIPHIQVKVIKIVRMKIKERPWEQQ